MLSGSDVPLWPNWSIPPEERRALEARAAYERWRKGTRAPRWEDVPGYMRDYMIETWTPPAS